MSFTDIIPDLYLGGDSRRWKNWQATYLEPTTCKECKDRHGKIFPYAAEYIPVHYKCRCKMLPMRTKEVGTATERGFDGADAWLMYRDILPDYYITKTEAIDLGWKSKKANLADVAPGKMIGGDIYKNVAELLPQQDGRIWFEADLDYTAGFRNTKRILYSNDGLVFASYDHEKTFYEITK